jgi:hypothetical protein
MKNQLKMELYSENELQQEAALEQIRALSDFEGGLFQPEKCDLGEPLREKFDPNDLNEPVRWLSQPAGRFSFKRIKPFRIQGYISNRKRRQLFTRDYKGGPLVPVVAKFPEPRFVTQWVVWLDWRLIKSKGPDLLKRFLTKMFLSSKSAYGFLTAEDDQKLKNFLVTIGEGTTTTKFVGDDPENGIPGLYWINIFGQVYTKWLGEALPNIPASVETLPDGSRLIQFGDSPQNWQDENIAAQQRSTIDLLGRDKFFDITQPARRLTPFPQRAVGL